MKISNQFKVFFVFLLFTVGCYSQTTNTKVKARIVYEENDRIIKITGTAENLTDILQSMSYSLSVIKKNSSNDNTSNNVQEGFFNLGPNENKNLSTTQINLGNEDEVIVLLLFYDESKKLIGKDRVVFGEEKKK
ncbi:curli-like amyloid fiber formation chaperone CsgH [uncultured Flavobacterium sp.]|uniref:curli-like amyloid fiber formation chaperone CsgH n=1 Tax=uncultured Flavobacterium sp. TaxID=165435 RepID=UPI0030EF7A81|tara:strand:+ start:560 stop:961 length:402 start_codon:yes stop_codon:yes gene_type:complete